MRTSRREFVKWVTASGIVLSLSRLASAEEPPFAARETLPGRGSWNPAATGMGRIDGVPKVTGAKLYASDFRAADLPGWPAHTSHAILVRAPDATRLGESHEHSLGCGRNRSTLLQPAAEFNTDISPS